MMFKKRAALLRRIRDLRREVESFRIQQSKALHSATELQMEVLRKRTVLRETREDLRSAYRRIEELEDELVAVRKRGVPNAEADGYRG